jgi:hypothetical protein
MLLHRIGLYLGTAVRNGRTIYGYKAKCGATIASAVQMAIGSQATTGPEPHAHCGKCFAEDAEHIDVKLPDGTLGGGVFDEMGRPLKARTEREDFTAPLHDTSAGKTEDFPYGAPIRRR